jgi:hypothetical protein
MKPTERKLENNTGPAGVPRLRDCGYPREAPPGPEDSFPPELWRNPERNPNRLNYLSKNAILASFTFGRTIVGLEPNLQS